MKRLRPGVATQYAIAEQASDVRIRMVKSGSPKVGRNLGALAPYRLSLDAQRRGKGAGQSVSAESRCIVTTLLLP